MHLKLVPYYILIYVFVSGSNTTHVYEFKHHPSFCPKPDWLKGDHGDELIFLFGFNRYYDNYKVSEEEEKLAKIMRTYWVQFATDG